MHRIHAAIFGPSGADQRKAQDGCQNGQQRLDALVQDVPLRWPRIGAFFHEPRVNRGDVVDLSLLPRISLGDIHRIHAGRPLGVSYGGERRPANSGAVRPQNSMNDERPTMNGLSPAVRPLNCVNDTILCQNETNDRQYSISKYT